MPPARSFYSVAGISPSQSHRYWHVPLMGLPPLGVDKHQPMSSPRLTHEQTNYWQFLSANATPLMGLSPTRSSKSAALLMGLTPTQRRLRMHSADWSLTQSLVEPAAPLMGFTSTRRRPRIHSTDGSHPHSESAEFAIPLMDLTLTQK